jgi:hypothetical protein
VKTFLDFRCCTSNCLYDGGEFEPGPLDHKLRFSQIRTETDRTTAIITRYVPGPPRRGAWPSTLPLHTNTLPFASKHIVVIHARTSGHTSSTVAGVTEQTHTQAQALALYSRLCPSL